MAGDLRTVCGRVSRRGSDDHRDQVASLPMMEDWGGSNTSHRSFDRSFDENIPLQGSNAPYPDLESRRTIQSQVLLVSRADIVGQTVN